MIPIDRSTNDRFYRYKMPELAVSFESNKTVLKNLNTISRSLFRDPNHILKFMGNVLGCTQITNSGKNDKISEKFVLNGNFEDMKLQSVLYDFIDIFVLCRECRNPETKFVVVGGILKRLCNGCGSVFNQEPNKLNSILIKDIGNTVFEDKNYEARQTFEDKGSICSNRFSTNVPIGESQDIVQDQIPERFVKASELKSQEEFLGNFNIGDILSKVEEMLERFGKEEKIENYLKALVEMGYPIEDIEEYFEAPRKGKKRHPLVKKGANYFLTNFGV